MNDYLPLLALLAVLASPPLIGRIWENLSQRGKTRLMSEKNLRK